MTVNTTARRVIGFGNGATTVWPYAFLIPLANELSVVYMNPNRDAIDPTGTGVVLNPAAYAVTGIGNVNGGNVTYPLAGPAVAAPVTITVVRTIPKTQPSTMANQGGAYPVAYEAALDNVEMQVQEVAEIFLRTPSLPIGFDVVGQGVSLVLPPPTPNAFIGWDATGKFLQNFISAASLIAPVAVGQIPFGAAGNTLAQDAGLTWDNAGKKFGVSGDANSAAFMNAVGGVVNWRSRNAADGAYSSAIYDATQHIVKVAGAEAFRFDVNKNFIAGADNAFDIGAAGATRPRTGYFGTSVVTPLVTAPGNLTLSSLGAVIVSNTLQPSADNSIALGFAGAGRWSQLFTPIIDSGTTGSLALKTNNGSEQLRLNHNTGTGLITIFNGGSGTANIRSDTSGSDTNVTIIYGTRGAGAHQFVTDALASNVIQLQVLHTASAATPATITGASGTGKPLISAGDGRGVGIFGTNTNDNSGSGQYGEYVSSTIATGASVALATGVTSNITSITLSAGDWDVSGCIAFTFGATTSYTNLAGGASSVTGTLGAQETTFDYETPATVPTAGKDMSFPVPTQRFSLAGSTTVFLVAQGTFTVSTLKAYGIIRARRVR